MGRIEAMKARHKAESQPLEDKRTQLVFRQKAERRELSDEQRVKRHLLIKSGRDKFDVVYEVSLIESQGGIKG